MKIIVTIICFMILIAPSAFSQKCKYDIDKKDEFTGEVTKVIETEIVDDLVKISVMQKGEEFTLNILCYLGGENESVMAKDSEILVKLENGKIITLKLANDVKPNTTVAYLGPGKTPNVVTYYLTSFEVDKNELETLSLSPITTIRIHIERDYDYDFTKKNKQAKAAKKLMESVKCFL